MEVPLRGFRGLERFRAGKRQAWTPIKSHGCGLGMPVAKKDKFHTCGGPRRRRRPGSADIYIICIYLSIYIYYEYAATSCFVGWYLIFANIPSQSVDILFTR